MNFLIKTIVFSFLIFSSQMLNGQTDEKIEKSNTSNVKEEVKEVRYYKFDYLKVKAGMHGDYLAMEKAWKKIHAYNIKAGKFVSWHLSRVVSPNGTNAEYDYVTRMTFKNEKQMANFLEKFPMPENLKGILTPEEMKLFDRTGEIRSLTKSEVWSSIDKVLSDNMEEAVVEVVNYFDFPKGKYRSDHIKVETEIWKPIHEARIKDGTMKGWVLARINLPFGSGLDYHDATVDLYKSMEDFMAANPMPYFEKVYPDGNLDKMMDETEAASTLVKGDVRIIIDNAVGEQ